jgi:hypothetical protein
MEGIDKPHTGKYKEIWMTGIMTPAVRLHHFRYGLIKFQALDLCCTECTIYVYMATVGPILRSIPNENQPKNATQENDLCSVKPFLRRRHSWNWQTDVFILKAVQIGGRGFPSGNCSWDDNLIGRIKNCVLSTEFIWLFRLSACQNSKTAERRKLVQYWEILQKCIDKFQCWWNSYHNNCHLTCAHV